jgi:putative ABC transport system permease protein
MKFSKIFINAVRGMVARKGRTSLSVLGILIGVAGVILIVSLGAGAQALVVGQITKLGSNLIGVLPGKSDESGPPAAVFGVQIKTLTIHDVEAMQDTGRAPYLVAVAPVVQGNATVVAGPKSVDTQFVGTWGSYANVQNVPLMEGRFMSEEEGRAGANVAVLGYTVARDLFGDQNAVGQVIKVKQVPLRVIGVAEKRGNVFFQDQDDQVYIPFPIGQRQLLGIDYLQFVRAKVDASEHVKASLNDVTTILREEHKIKDVSNDDFSVRDLADAIKILTSITDVLRMFLAFMAGISLLVGGIGIMNIMLVTVSERTREIGLRKAIGATSKTIQRQFLFEAVIITFSGGLLGIVVGVLLSFIISLGATALGYDWSFIISGGSILVATLVSAGVGIAFGYYPAKRASKLDPIVALRYE